MATTNDLRRKVASQAAAVKPMFAGRGNIARPEAAIRSRPLFGRLREFAPRTPKLTSIAKRRRAGVERKGASAATERILLGP